MKEPERSQIKTKTLSNDTYQLHLTPFSRNKIS